MKIKVIAISALLSLFLASSATPASGVTYGDEIVDASISKPWVASIWFASDDDEYADFVCSGSLIAPDIVLTAGHCLTDLGSYTVQLQANTLYEENWLYIEADATWISPRFDKKKLQNDLGLLHLSEPVTSFEPIAFAGKSLLSKVNSLKKFKIYGWGDDQNGDVSTYLKFATLTEKKKAALALYGKSQFNSVTTLAAGRYISAERVYAGACSGDSGGPLTASINGQEMVVGITSYRTVSCRMKAPSVFTKTSYYEGDIKSGIMKVRLIASSIIREAPRVVVSPYITGSPTPYGTLKCNPGTWSSDTVSTNLEWSAPPFSWSPPTSSSIRLPITLRTSLLVTCTVTATNRYGQTSASVSVIAR